MDPMFVSLEYLVIVHVRRMLKDSAVCLVKTHFMTSARTTFMAAQVMMFTSKWIQVTL